MATNMPIPVGLDQQVNRTMKIFAKNSQFKI